MASIYINGYDLSQSGFVLDMVNGHRSVPPISRPDIEIAGRIGSVLLSQEETFEPRKIKIDGYVFGDTAPDMMANIEELTARLTQSGDLEIKIADDESRLFYGRLTSMPDTPLRPALLADKTRYAIQLTCYDPRAYATGPSTLGFGSTAADVPLGTAPSGGIVRVSGAASAPSLVYRSSTGGELARITLNTTLSSTQYVDVDLDNFTLKSAAGGSVAAIWASSVSEWFFPNPADGEYWSSGWPTVEVTAGSAGYTYTKTYW